MDMDGSVSLNLGDLLRIQDIGFHMVNDLYTHPDRKLDWNVFLYIVNGEMQVREEGKEYVVSNGQFLFLKSGLHHWGDRKTPAGTSWYWIHFYNAPSYYPEFKLLLGSFQTISYDEYNRTLRLPKHGSMLKAQIIESKLDSMNQLYNSADPLRAVTLSLQSTELFLDLFKESLSLRQLSKADKTVQRVIEYIEHKETHALNSKEIEDHLHMNYTYLCKVFKAKTGSTIHNYNTQVFVNKAKIMMRDTTLNISEISDRLGFSSPFYFSRIFKKVVGSSPSEYICKI